MDITEAKFDEKSHLSQVMWAEKLSNTVEYHNLNELWEKKLDKMEERLHSLTITAEERDRLAHSISAFKVAMFTLQEHYAVNLKLHREESEREEQPVQPKKPVL